MLNNLMGYRLIAVEHMVEPDSSRTVPPRDLHERMERNARRWRGRWPGGVDLRGQRRPMEPLESVEVHPMKPMDNVIRTADAMFAHPATIRKIEEAIKRQAKEAQDALTAYALLYGRGIP